MVSHGEAGQGQRAWLSACPRTDSNRHLALLGGPPLPLGYGGVTGDTGPTCQVFIAPLLYGNSRPQAIANPDRLKKTRRVTNALIR